MKQGYQQLLQPKILGTVSGLALIARVIVDGYLSGLNNSRRVGPGMEFSQYRGYEPGDDLRQLDWKMLARSERYYIKQSEVETHIAVKFILDASNSMSHKEGAISKMDFVRVLTASLAFLAQKQGDAIGLFALNEHRLHFRYPRVQKQQFNRFLLELLQIENKGRWPADPEATQKLHDRSHKELIFFITDLYEQNEELTSVITRLKTSRNEVIVLHVMGRQELTFDYSGQVIFEDLESGIQRKVNSKQAREGYLYALNKEMNSLKNELLTNGITYHLFRMDEDIGTALQVFLKNRNSIL